MRWRFLLAAIAVAVVVAPNAQATLYAATVRSQVAPGSTGLAGNLYTVNPESGVSTLVGPIRVEGTTPIGVTGLAVHPASGVMYGVTALASPNHPRSLVTIDPGTGTARLVGSLGAVGSDIAFDNRGNLFVWLRETRQAGIIDLGTGTAIPLGTPGPPGPTGGFAIDTRGTAYVAATGASGTLDRVDTNTGAITSGPSLAQAPYPAGINSLAVSADGTIFGVNTNLGSPASTVLVKIDAATGVVTRVGALPNDTDALAFAESASAFASLRTPGTVLLVAGILAVVAAIAFVALGNRRTQ